MGSIMDVVVVRNLLLLLAVLGLASAPPAAADATTLRIGGSGTTYTTMQSLASAFEQATPGVTMPETSRKLE